MEVVTIGTLASIKYENYGDKRAWEFYNTWIDTATRMDNKLDDVHLHNMLYQELKKSNGLKIHLHNYKDLPKVDKTYDALLRLFRRWVQEKMEDP